MVECALIYPILFLLILGVMVGGTGMFRYQQMAALSRDAARYAVVHGGQYAKENGVPAATAGDIQNLVSQRAAAMNLANLTTSVTWNTNNMPYHTVVVNGDILQVRNTVTVQVTYLWDPGMFLSPVTLSSTSCMPMEY